MQRPLLARNADLRPGHIDSPYLLKGLRGRAVQQTLIAWFLHDELF